jgi:DNA-binding CsgD family transcriptional regulator/tetratricopeptide (TPR) repeat protein
MGQTAGLPKMLLGRDAELSRLAALVTELAAGRGGAALVEGEPGIGKSASLRAAATDAASRGCQVFWAAGDPLGTAFPLVPLLDAFAIRESAADPARAEVARALHGSYGGSGAGSAAAAAELLLALVDEVCAAAPALLVMDDLQWADQTTVGVCHRLARTAPQRALLVVGAMRPLPRRTDLKALRRTIGARAVLRLQPLPDDAVTALVTELAGAAPGAELRELTAGAAGNPLYLTELVAALDRGGTLKIAGGFAHVTGGTAPAGLAEAILDRLDFLPDPARETVRAAALLGEDFTAAALASVLRRPVADLLPALDDARAAGVLIETGDTLGFRHPLIRAALYEELPAPIRAAWHAEAARALDQAGAPLEAVARQLLGSAGPDRPAAADGWLLDWLAANAEALINTAPGVAAAALEPAVAATPADDPRHHALGSRLAEALYRMGRIADAELVATRTLPHLTDPDLLVQMYDTLARCRAGTQEMRPAVDQINRAMATPRMRPIHRARLGVVAAKGLAWSLDFDGADRLAREALATGDETKDRWTMGWAFNTLGIVAAWRGEMKEAYEAFDHGQAVTADDPALTDLHLALMINQANALHFLDEPQQALQGFRKVCTLADRTGNLPRLSMAQDGIVHHMFITGRWDDALAECELPGATVDPQLVCSAYGRAAVIALHRGEAATATRHLDAGAVHAERLGDRVVAAWILAKALDREQAGRPQDALALLGAKTEQVLETEYWVADAVRLALSLGEHATAAVLTARAETFPGVGDSPRRQAMALHCRGLLDADPTLLLEAAERYERAVRPLPRAQALEAAAGLLAAGGDVKAARAAFDQAFDIYTGLGATWDLTRLRAAFRPYGFRRGHGTSARRHRPTHGWEALTKTERTVAGLVAEGLSNPRIADRLVLSRRTVEVHVASILRKLDASSRVEIAVAASRRAGAPS